MLRLRPPARLGGAVWEWAQKKQLLSVEMARFARCLSLRIF